MTLTGADMNHETAVYGGDTPWMIYWGRKLKHWLAHLVPRTHWTSYRIEGWEQAVADADAEELDGLDADDLRELGPDRDDEHWVCIWRQWLGIEWDVVHFRVEEAA